jgi:fumarate hydratase subunit alpha
MLREDSLREIDARLITDTVARLCVEACYHLPEDVLQALRNAQKVEASPLGRDILQQLLDNADLARQGEYPLCQDTGYTVVFLDLGQDVHVSGGDLYECITAGVRRAYQDGYLRKSVVTQPYSKRVNTHDNTPPIVHTRIVPGDRLKITVLPKGGGSENMSYVNMMPPAMGRQGVIDYVVHTVDDSGASPCPPVVVGVGVGGTADYAMLLAKEALLRQVGQPSDNPEDAALEVEILQRINALGIGPQGLGGTVTALAVHVNSHPCHIASLPVAVNLQCHSARHKEALL